MNKTPTDVTAGKRYTIVYTNYKGDVSTRDITLKRIYWASNNYYPEPQFLIDAHCHVKDALRTFALLNIHDLRESVS